MPCKDKKTIGINYKIKNQKNRKYPKNKSPQKNLLNNQLTQC